MPLELGLKIFPITFSKLDTMEDAIRATLLLVDGRKIQLRMVDLPIITRMAFLCLFTPTLRIRCDGNDAIVSTCCRELTEAGKLLKRTRDIILIGEVKP
jgi:hypothetical protein